jgi:hypothetical protein
MNNEQIHDIVKEDEDRVKRYFEGRGFTVVPLDTKGHKTRTRRCDFEISKQDTHFLCEVESIFSVLPGEMRFRSAFEKEIHERFKKSPACIMPYWVAISTHQTQLPPKHARENFLAWLETTLLALGFNNEQLYCELHYPWDRNRLFDLTATINVLIGSQNGSLDFSIMTGGSMGYREKIEEKVEDAIAQLNATVAEKKEEASRIPRVIILSSHVAPPIFDPIDMPAIATAMKNHSELSAIAVLRSVIVEQPKAQPMVKTFEDIVEGTKRPRKRKDAFSVFHNLYLTEADSLDVTVFDDGLSFQYSAEHIKKICAVYNEI